MPSYAACRQRRSSVALGLAAHAPRWNAIRHQNGSGPSRAALDDDESRPGTGACRDHGQDPVSKQTASCVFACVFACVCVCPAYTFQHAWLRNSNNSSHHARRLKVLKANRRGACTVAFVTSSHTFTRAIARASLTRASAVLGWPLC
jgi:hypothetical protein